MNEEKTKIASYVVMFSLHMCSFIFADFQDKPMGAVSVFTNRNLSTSNLTVRCCFVLLSLFIYVVDFSTTLPEALFAHRLCESTLDISD